MYNLLTPLTRVHLSKHYTTKTTIIAYPGERENFSIYFYRYQGVANPWFICPCF